MSQGSLRRKTRGNTSLARHAADVDVDADRGEVVLDDLRDARPGPRPAAVEPAVELGVVVAAAGEPSRLGEVGNERVHVVVAVAGHARRQAHLGGSRAEPKLPPAAASARRSTA